MSLAIKQVFLFGRENDCKVGEHRYNGGVFDMKTPKEYSPWWRTGLLMMARLSAWTFMPVLIGYFLGRFIDDRLKTEPLMFIAFTACAFLIALVKIYHIAKGAMDEVSPKEGSIDRDTNPEARNHKKSQNSLYGINDNQSTESDDRDSSIVP